MVEAGLARGLQVVRAVAAREMAGLTQVALATLHQLAPPKEIAAALERAMVAARNSVVAVVAVQVLLDQTHQEHQPAELVAQERLVRLRDQALLALVAGVAALMSEAVAELPVLAAQGGVVEAEVRTKEQVFQEPPTLEEVEGLLVIPMLEVQTIHLAMAGLV
jgi:hypothetical protein